METDEVYFPKGGGTPLSQLRRWCPVGEMHQDADDPICCGCDPSHRLRIRRMLVCSECEMGLFTKEGFDRHECYSAY